MSKGIHELDEDIFERVIVVNLRSVVVGCKYAIARILKQELHSSGHRGWIANTPSIAAFAGLSVCRTSLSADIRILKELIRFLSFVCSLQKSCD